MYRAKVISKDCKCDEYTCYIYKSKDSKGKFISWAVMHKIGKVFWSVRTLFYGGKNCQVKTDIKINK